MEQVSRVLWKPTAYASKLISNILSHGFAFDHYDPDKPAWTGEPSYVVLDGNRDTVTEPSFLVAVTLASGESRQMTFSPIEMPSSCSENALYSVLFLSADSKYFERPLIENRLQKLVRSALLRSSEQLVGNNTAATVVNNFAVPRVVDLAILPMTLHALVMLTKIVDNRV